MAGLTEKQQRFVEEFLVDVERFWSYVDRRGENDCWLWTRAKQSAGYGAFHVGISRNSTMLAHRVAHGLTTGEAPEAVCHRCDNPPCCNPRHLVGETRKWNNRDMVAKGRHAAQTGRQRSKRGENHPAAKLSDDDVREIRRRYDRGDVTQYRLAEEFGVCQRTVAKVVRRIGWSHV